MIVIILKNFGIQKGEICVDGNNLELSLDYLRLNEFIFIIIYALIIINLV